MLCFDLNCSLFSYVWHGTLEFILIWSLLNFLGITLEGVGRVVGKHEEYQRLEARSAPAALHCAARLLL